jgi:hypothetical protein
MQHHPPPSRLPAQFRRICYHRARLGVARGRSTHPPPGYSASPGPVAPSQVPIIHHIRAAESDTDPLDARLNRATLRERPPGYHGVPRRRIDEPQCRSIWCTTRPRSPDRSAARARSAWLRTPTRPGSARACRASSGSHPCAPAAPAPCGCRIRAPAGASQTRPTRVTRRTASPSRLLHRRTPPPWHRGLVQVKRLPARHQRDTLDPQQRIERRVVRCVVRSSCHLPHPRPYPALTPLLTPRT